MWGDGIMTEQEQIEEMAKVIDITIHNECLLNNNGHCIDCKFLDKNTNEYECQSLLVSTLLYNTGYRKVSDNYIGTDKELCSIDYRPANKVRKELAKEIFKAIKEILDNADQISDNLYTSYHPDFGYDTKQVDKSIYELAKHYGVEVE